MRNYLAIFVAPILCAGCTVGPNYKRPVATVPDTYRGLTTEEVARAETASLGDQKWWEVFQDEQLQALVRTSLQQNYDVRIAAARILQARAQLGITRSNQFPSVSAGADITSQRLAKSPRFPEFEETSGQLTLSAAWELDFWGKYRRATQAARANLLASEWGRRAVITTLVSNIASAYFQLRAFDLQLEISKETLASRRDSLRLTQLLADHGSTSMLDVRQAEQLVFTAAAEIPTLEQQIEQEENFISSLLGENPGSVPRGRKLTDQPHSPSVPAGLPSVLLERRPDIREAEQQLIAANAQIGVAKAAYFPDISLTGTGGFQSPALVNLFSGPAGLWTFAHAATTSYPIRPGRGTALRHAVQGRRCELPRGVDKRYELLHSRTGTCAGPVQRAPSPGPALQRARWWLAAIAHFNQQEMHIRNGSSLLWRHSMTDAK